MDGDVEPQQVAREEDQGGQRGDGEDEGGVAGELVAGLRRFDDAHRETGQQHGERCCDPPAGCGDGCRRRIGGEHRQRGGLEPSGRLDEGQIDAAVVEAHDLVDHRQLEVRAGIVHRDAAALGEDELQQQVGREQQYDGLLRVARGVVGEERGEGGVAREERQCAEDEHQRRFGERAVERFAAGSHPFERTAGVHRREDERRAAQGQQVGEGHQVAVEREQRRQVAHGDEERGQQRRAQADGRCGAEERRHGRRIDGSLAEQQAEVAEVLREADAPASGQTGPRAVDEPRNRKGREQQEQRVEKSHTSDQIEDGQQEYQRQEGQREEDVVVDLARAQPHDAGVDAAQQFDPPGREEPSDAVAVADVEGVRAGEDFALRHGGAFAAVLRQGGGDGLQPFGEGFARVLHLLVGRGEAAAPRGAAGDAAAAEQAAPEPEQQRHDGGQQPGRASGGGQRGRQEPVGGVGRSAEEEVRGARHGGHGRAGEQPDEEDARQRQRHGGDAVVVGLGGFGHLVRAGRAEEHRAVELGEGQHHHAADEGQRRQRGRRGEGVAARGDAVEQPEVDEQLRDEAVQGRQGADGRRAGEEEQRRQRHVAAQSAEAVERGGVRRREDVARAEEEERLEKRVVGRVEQRPGDARQRDELVARGLAQRGDADADEDDADVLDRGVGQQAFHVVLRRG